MKTHQNMKKKMGVTDLVWPPATQEDLPFYADMCFFLVNTFILLYFSCTFELMEGKRKIIFPFQNFPVLI